MPAWKPTNKEAAWTKINSNPNSLTKESQESYTVRILTCKRDQSSGPDTDGRFRGSAPSFTIGVA